MSLLARGPAWRAALRQARRDVARSKGRSLLVAVMVGTPVLLTVALATIIVSGNVSSKENLSATMGRAAAVATSDPDGTVLQNFDGTFSYSRGGEAPEPTTARLTELTGADVLALTTGRDTVRWADGASSVDVLQADFTAPVTQGLVDVVDGRAPRTTSEVVVSPALADRGLGIGATVQMSDGSRVEVVGVGGIKSVKVDPNIASVASLPGAFTMTADQANMPSALIASADPIGWDAVNRLNLAGFVVSSRAVIENPPPAAEAYPDFQDNGSGSATRTVVALVATAIVIEVVLLAGPAFAVGVRRQRRELALLAATGAEPRDVRRVVLAQALVLGALSCLVGAVLGVVAAWGVVIGAPRVFPVAFGPFEVRPEPIVIAVALGIVASLIAAWVPARQIARQDVAAVLAGRRGTVRSSRGWPVVGALLITGGAALCFTLGVQQGGEVAVAAGTIIVVVGAVLVTPLLVGGLGRLASRAPVPLRIALRDTARQRARSAPAIAAVMAAVAGLTAVAIASASDFEQSRRTYSYTTTEGRTVVSSDAATFDGVREAAASSTGVDFVPLTTADNADPDVSLSLQAVDASPDSYVVDHGIVVADAATLRAWGVRLDEAARTALEDGSVLTTRGYMHGEQVIIQRLGPGAETPTATRFPAVVADLSEGAVPAGSQPQVASAVMSPSTARAAGIDAVATQAISAPGSRALTGPQEDAALEAVQQVAPDAGSLLVERGFTQSYGLVLIVLLAAGAVAVLVGSLSATGLALSDARPDFSTLAAVGASPRVRRLVAGSQAGILALAGALLGIVVGFVPGIAATWPLTSNTFSANAGGPADPVIAIPWLALLVIGVAVPLLAALVALVATRSKLVIVRRLAQ